MIDTLTVVLLNAENLFISMDLYQGEDLHSMNEFQWQKMSSGMKANKELAKILELAQFLMKNAPNLILLTEVGGRHSLGNFAKYFLNDLYCPYLIEGNSDRGIDMGYLVRRDLPLDRKISSNKDFPVLFRNKSEKFSRDLLELEITCPQNVALKWHFFLCHLKSKLPKPDDPKGILRRAAEMEAIISIVEKRRQESPNSAFILAGDFNGNASGYDTDWEFSEIYRKTDLQDALHAKGESQEIRCTYAHFPSFGELIPQQIDYIFTSRNIVVEEAVVLHFDRPMCSNLLEKMKFPSDHFPIWAKLSIKK